jgi:hypothetical protein
MDEWISSGTKVGRIIAVIVITLYTARDREDD